MTPQPLIPSSWPAFKSPLVDCGVPSQRSLRPPSLFCWLPHDILAPRVLRAPSTPRVPHFSSCAHMPGAAMPPSSITHTVPKPALTTLPLFYPPRIHEEPLLTNHSHCNHSLSIGLAASAFLGRRRPSRAKSPPRRAAASCLSRDGRRLCLCPCELPCNSPPIFNMLPCVPGPCNVNSIVPCVMPFAQGLHRSCTRGGAALTLSAASRPAPPPTQHVQFLTPVMYPAIQDHCLDRLASTSG